MHKNMSEQRVLQDERNNSYPQDTCVCPHGAAPLPIAFIASAITGFGLHTAAGHDTSHENWQMWSVAHTIASLLWLLSATAHIKRHKLWYKDIASKGISHKRWITFFLSLLFLMTVCTGIVLITYVTGANSSLGLMHYKLGLLLLTFSLIHILCRK